MHRFQQGLSLRKMPYSKRLEVQVQYPGSALGDSGFASSALRQRSINAAVVIYTANLYIPIEYSTQAIFNYQNIAVQTNINTNLPT